MPTQPTQTRSPVCDATTTSRMALRGWVEGETEGVSKREGEGELVFLAPWFVYKELGREREGRGGGVPFVSC